MLSGSSLHGHYDFRVSRPVSPHFALGNLTLKDVRLLAPGDIRKIIPGRDYIHSLFHLDRPSTTLTVRTIGLPHAQPQFSYLPPGVAIDPFFSDPAIIKRAQTADVLFGMNHADADEIVGGMLARPIFTPHSLYCASLTHTSCTTNRARSRIVGKDSTMARLDGNNTRETWRCG